MRILYLDCFSGISGDMSLAALVDAGADRTFIEQQLAKIPLEPFKLEWNYVVKQGISALKLDVIIDPDTKPVDHRHYSTIKDMIAAVDFPETVKINSIAIFEKIAVAEAKIHGVPLAKVHFHEVGAIDSIVDIIGFSLALYSLEIDNVVAAPIPLGFGKVKCAHGLYPVPAPATLEIVKGLPITESTIKKELTTPTGAAIVAALAEKFTNSIPEMKVKSVGYGAGTRDLKQQPNVLRAVIGTGNI